MPQNFNFQAPTRIAFGVGRIDKLGADLARLDQAGNASRVLLVSDPGVAEAGLTGRVADILLGAGLDAALFTEVKSDPLAASADAAAPQGGRLPAPMPGRVVAVPVAAGDPVSRGQTLMVIEAMKMEHGIVAPADGEVERVNYAVGDTVEEGAELITLREEEQDRGD